MSKATMKKNYFGYQYKGIQIYRLRYNRWSVRSADAFPNYDGTGEPSALFYSLEAAKRQIDKVAA